MNPTTFQKHAVLLSMMLSVSLILFATFLYPGGSISDINSPGFDWKHNFISNLFNAKAINGSDNPARWWAFVGMAFHSLTYTLFFINFSKKIPHPKFASIVKYIGILNLVLITLVATPLHDLMIPITSTTFLTALFIITYFIIKSRHNYLKVLCVLCMLLYYLTMFVYGTGNWELLAVLQKTTFIFSSAVILSLEYFTQKEDFAHLNKS
jgi:hypothetical protein